MCHCLCDIALPRWPVIHSRCRRNLSVASAMHLSHVNYSTHDTYNRAHKFIILHVCGRRSSQLAALSSSNGPQSAVKNCVCQLLLGWLRERAHSISQSNNQQFTQNKYLLGRNVNTLKPIAMICALFEPRAATDSWEKSVFPSGSIRCSIMHYNNIFPLQQT